MQNPILVGIDFEARSTPAILEHAYLQGRALGRPVLLVHVVEPIEDPRSADAESRAFHEALLEKSQDQMRGLAAAAPSEVVLETAVELGPRVEVLRRLAEQRGALMLVLGSPFRGGPPVGVGLQLLAQSPCPMLIVPYA